jgi:hypothetical protein
MIWEFSRLPNGKYLVTRTARSGSPSGLSYQAHGIATSLDGSFVITTVTSDAWRCPQDPTDPCELYRDEQKPELAEVRCAGDEVTLCARAGVTSDVYVTDYATRATAHFGWFSRRPEPSVSIEAKRVVVTAGECTQIALLPLVAAPQR